VARVLTAAIVLLIGPLQAALRYMGVVQVFRWGAVILCGFYFLGLLALLWAPETKDRPLPEE